MSARPILGTKPSLIVADMPANAPGTLLVGAPRTPVDLVSIGMPGCLGYVVPFLFVSLQTTGTTASMPLTIPNHPIVIGSHITCQGVAHSPSSNASGFIVSNPLCISLGR
jgi:hypothetical protein